jgi:serine/threonine protein kinase
MERMKAPLFAVLPQFVSKSSKKSIDVGPIACKLIQICQRMHESKHILLDVKPDNLMVTQHEKDWKTSRDLADAVRLVDLGLVAMFGGASGHTPNDGIVEVQGTPLYASLHVHNLQKPSRRDDLESMLYVIGDLIYHVQGGKKPYMKGASYLPWCVGTSDDAIGKLKLDYVSNLQSAYYQNILSKEAATILFQCWEHVHTYKYSQVPQYDVLYNMLQSLEVLVAAKKQKTASAPKSPVRPASKRRTRSSVDTLEADEKEELSHAPPGKKSAKGLSKQEDSEVSMDDAEGGEEVSDMDIDHEDDRKPPPKKKTPMKKAAQKSAAMQLIAHNSSGLTSKYILEAGGMEVLFLSEANKEIHISPTNVEKDAFVSLRLCSINDGLKAEVLAKTPVVKVDGVKVTSVTVVSVNSTIQCKSVLIEVKGLDDVAAKEPIKTLTNDRPTSTGVKSVASKNAPTKPNGARAIVRIESGPHAGDTLLQTGVCDRLIVGSAPTRKGTHLKLSCANGVSANHVQLDFVDNNGVPMVKVTDLKSENRTLFNGKLMISSKTETAFCDATDIRVGDTLLKIVRN